MSFFPETIKIALAGYTVRMSYLVLLDFVGEPMRLWTGYGRIVTGGYEWRGLGDVASIDGLEPAINGLAPEAKFILSGVNPDTIRLTRDEFKAKVRDRLARVFLQFHNDADAKPLILYDQPYAIWSGSMKSPEFNMNSDGTRTIQVGCESLFSLRSRPVAAQYTDRDQDRRFAGDLGFAFVPFLRNQVVTWPDF